MTLAPFVNPEKPQVSPWPAASFIKRRTIVCISGLAAVEPCHPRHWTRQIIAIGGCPCIYYIFLLFRWDGIRAIAGPGKSGAGISWRRDGAAQVRVMPRPQVPIWSGPLQFCNSFPSVSARHPTKWTSAETPVRRKASGNHGEHLPKSWANAGAFSPLTLKSKLAHN